MGLLRHIVSDLSPPLLGKKVHKLFGIHNADQSKLLTFLSFTDLLLLSLWLKGQVQEHWLEQQQMIPNLRLCVLPRTPGMGERSLGLSDYFK